MTPHTPQLQRNVPFRLVKLAKGNPLLSLRAIPFLVMLASSIAIQPAVGISPVFKTIAVTAPGGIFGTIADPTRSAVYAADGLNSRISVIDTISSQISFFISTAHPPVGLALSPDSNTLYVTEGPDFLEAISLTTLETLFVEKVESSPEFPAVSPDDSAVYVPCSSTGDIVPVGGPLLGAPIHIGGSPVNVAFNQSGTVAFATNETLKISMINTATGAVHKFATPSKTFGLLLSGRTLYATAIGAIYVISLPSTTIVDTIKLPKPAAGKYIATLPALTPDGGFLYVPLPETTIATTLTNIVVVVDTSTNTIQSTFTVGTAPLQVAAAANDLFGYSSNLGDGTVTAFDLAHVFP